MNETVISDSAAYRNNTANDSPFAHPNTGWVIALLVSLFVGICAPLCGLLLSLAWYLDILVGDRFPTTLQTTLISISFPSLYLASHCMEKLHDQIGA